MKSDAAGGGGGASGNNVTINIQKVYILIIFLKGRNLQTEIFTIVRVSMKFVIICHTRKFISAKLFKTGHQQSLCP